MLVSRSTGADFLKVLLVESRGELRGYGDIPDGT